MAADYEGRVARLRTPEECRRMERNAVQRGRDDIALLARKKRVELGAAQDIAAGDSADVVEQELWRALNAYEQVLGRSASRTRQMIRNRGLVSAADQMVQQRKESAGFTKLVDAGLIEHAWESVVVRHPESFSAGALHHAQARLERHEATAEIQD